MGSAYHADMRSLHAEVMFDHAYRERMARLPTCQWSGSIADQIFLEAFFRTRASVYAEVCGAETELEVA